jgi:hypothetical protein
MIKPSNRGDSYHLLRLGGRAKGKEQSAKAKTNNFISHMFAAPNLLSRSGPHMTHESVGL